MKAEKTNELHIKIPAISQNEGVCRSLVSSFVAQLDPTIDELADIKCSVSEAVTNCIVHAYRGRRDGLIYISVRVYTGRLIRIEVRDCGIGIDDIARAREPLFTTDPGGERSGMGFSVMESFMDSLHVTSKPGRGTKVVMKKRLS